MPRRCVLVSLAFVAGAAAANPRFVTVVVGADEGR
jgi:hypothetical protein